MITIALKDTSEYRVYHIKTADGESLYVGQSKNVMRRLDDHKRSSVNLAFWEYLQSHPIESLVVDMYTLAECESATEEEGQDAVSWMECNLINQFRPKFNRRQVKYVRKRYHEKKFDFIKFSCDWLPY